MRCHAIHCLLQCPNESIDALFVSLMRYPEIMVEMLGICYLLMDEMIEFVLENPRLIRTWPLVILQFMSSGYQFPANLYRLLSGLCRQEAVFLLLMTDPVFFQFFSVAHIRRKFEKLRSWRTLVISVWM
jgi:hypothetical protein